MQYLVNILLATHYPPKDSWFNWIFGPQMLGVIFLIIGSIQYRYPPKNINNWYGYRTDTSKRNQETWDEAQRYSALYMIKIGLYSIVIGLLISAILIFSRLPDSTRAAITIMFVIAGGMAPALLMIVNTEKHLTKKFGDK